MESYRKEIAVIFQDFKTYNFSIAENISMSKGKDNKLNEVLGFVGLSKKVESLKEGLDTNLGTQYEEAAVDFSGGEKQKLALARMLYKDSSLIILDEPTSSLDPLSEYELYKRYNDILGEKSIIFISHTINTTKFSNKILALDNNKVEVFNSSSDFKSKNMELYNNLFKAI